MGIRTALVVDDSRSARYILQRLLERRHIQVDLVGSAQQALAYLSEHRPDVVFMDEMMPGMEGHVAVDQLAANPDTQTIPIIMYTGRDYWEAEPPVLRPGVIGVLSKPFTSEDVNALLERLEQAGVTTEQSPPSVAKLIRTGEPVDTLPASVAPPPAVRVAQAPEPVSIERQLDSLRSELTGAVKSEVRWAVDQWLGETLESQIAEQIEAQYVTWRGALNDLRVDQARFQGKILEQRIPRLLDLLENRLEQRMLGLQKSLTGQISSGGLSILQRTQITNIVRSEVVQATHRPARQAARQVAAELMRTEMSLLTLRVERIGKRMNSVILLGASGLLICVVLAYFAGTLR